LQELDKAVFEANTAIQANFVTPPCHPDVGGQGGTIVGHTKSNAQA